MNRYIQIILDNCEESIMDIEDVDDILDLLKTNASQNETIKRIVWY